MRKLTNQLLQRVYLKGLPLQSNLARQHDQLIAALASSSMISTREAPHQYGRIWRITEEGLAFLRDEGLL